MGLQTQLLLAMEKPFGKHKAGLSFALFGAAIQQQDPCGTTHQLPPQTKQPPRCRALKEAKGQILPRKRARPVLTEPHFCAVCQQSTEGKDDLSLAR